MCVYIHIFHSFVGLIPLKTPMRKAASGREPYKTYLPHRTFEQPDTKDTQQCRRASPFLLGSAQLYSV